MARTRRLPPGTAAAPGVGRRPVLKRAPELDDGGAGRLPARRPVGAPVPIPPPVGAPVPQRPDFSQVLPPGTAAAPGVPDSRAPIGAPTPAFGPQPVGSPKQMFTTIRPQMPILKRAAPVGAPVPQAAPIGAPVPQTGTVSSRPPQGGGFFGKIRDFLGGRQQGGFGRPGQQQPFQMQNVGTRSEGYTDQNGVFHYGRPGVGPNNPGPPGTAAAPGVPDPRTGGGPGGGGSPRNAFEDLRSQTFRPPEDTQNVFDRQAQDLLGRAGVSREFDPQTQQGRDMILQAMQNLQGGPDRIQLAKDAFNIFREETDPQFQQRLRGVGQKAAALGRVGAGLTTNDLTGALEQRNRQLDLQERGLINTAAQQIMGDRLNTLSGLTGSTGLLGDQALGRDQTSASFDLNRAGLSGQFGRDQFGRQQQGRDDLFRERGFQQGLSQQAIDNRIQQALLEEQLRGGAHTREMDDLSLLTRLSQGNPASQFLSASQPPTGPSAFDLGINALQGGAVSGPAVASRPVDLPGLTPQPGNIFQNRGIGLQPDRQNRSIFGRA